MLLLRYNAEIAPYVHIGKITTLGVKPDRTEVFGPPDAALLPMGPCLLSNEALVIWEHYGRFTIRDLATGFTERPPPKPEGARLFWPIPVGSTAYYFAWGWGTGEPSAVWARTAPKVSVPVLKDATYSYDAFTTDGKDAVWNRSKGPLGEPGKFQVVELWTSPVTADPKTIAPKKVATIPDTWIATLAVGEGWAVAHLDAKNVLLYRLSDGTVKKVPPIPDGGYDEPENLFVAGGKVWLNVRDIPGSDVRRIVRYDIDALPAP